MFVVLDVRIMEHGFNGGSKLWRDAYGAMVLEARGDGLANCFTLTIFGSNGLLEKVFDSGELVQWKGGDFAHAGPLWEHCQ